VYAAYLVKALRPKVKFVSIIGSYGWGEKTVDMLADIVSTLKAEIIEPVIIKEHPKDSDFELLDKLAEKINTRHVEIGAAD
jgi:flavorubredoxin